jgi:hypothetical protein
MASEFSHDDRWLGLGVFGPEVGRWEVGGKRSTASSTATRAPAESTAWIPLPMSACWRRPPAMVCGCGTWPPARKSRSCRAAPHRPSSSTPMGDS